MSVLVWCLLGVGVGVVSEVDASVVVVDVSSGVDGGAPIDAVQVNCDGGVRRCYDCSPRKQE